MAPPRPPAPPGLDMHPSAPPVAAAPGNLNYAGFGVRFVAAIIDSLLLSALMIPFIIVVVVFMMRSGGDPSPLAMILVFDDRRIFAVSINFYREKRGNSG
jgi:hypothetical protein